MTQNKYVALLRGINVGGKNIIKMSALKKVIEDCGMRNVSTLIQSGNVLFETDETNITKIVNLLEKTLSHAFDYESKVIVISRDQLEVILSDAPTNWKTGADVRCYIAFVGPSVTPLDLLKQIKLKDGIDSAKIGVGMLYMTTIFSGITKSGFSKLVGTKVYKEITIRNYNTTKKIFERMQEHSDKF